MTSICLLSLATLGGALLLPGPAQAPPLQNVALFAVTPHPASQSRGPGLRSAGTPSGSPSLLKPGVYRTSPYSCLVIAPAPNLDEKFVISAPEHGTERMPQFVPKLKFEPYPAKKTKAVDSKR